MGFSRPSGDSLRVHGGKEKRKKTAPSAYNSYYEGYTEFYEVGENGRKKHRYVYTDPYYKHDLTRKQWIWLKVFYSFAFILMTALFIYAGIQPYLTQTLWYLQGATLFLIAWLFYILIAFYIPTKQLLTAYLYKKSSKPLMNVSLAVAVALGGVAVVLVAYLISDKNTSFINGLPAVLAYLVAGVIAILMFFTEKKIKYVRVKNNNVVPEDGYKIFNDKSYPSERSDAVKPGELRDE